VNITGFEEILQRIIFRLVIKKGSFIYDEELGSEIYKIKNNKEDVKIQAFIIIKEVLKKIPGVNFKKIEIENLENENIKLIIYFIINKDLQELEVII